MTYQVIARKWRPQTFEEVTGQEHITRTLRAGIEHDRLHHAYLFSGARGVGKTTTARLLAKAVNCHKSDRPTAAPCSSKGEEPCPSCREIAEGRSIDVLEIDAASNTGVDNVRDAIIESVGVRPARDRYKVFIIDEVHMLSPAAFNALLKTLEEPPPRVLFIMATTHAHKVPDTILSRCQQFEFRTISSAKIAERLKLIAKEEGVRVADEALREIARAGEGSMRDAQSAFDQVISFSEGRIGVGDVENALGIAGGEMLGRVMRAVAGQAAGDALAVVDELVSRGHDLRNFCRDLLAHVRDLLVLKAAGEATALADAGEAERRALIEEAADFSESDLVRFFHSLTETETHLRESAHPRYQLEMGLVKLVEMRRLAPLGQILERLSALEEALRTGRAPAAGGTAPTPASGTGSGATRRGSGAGGGASSAASSSARQDESLASPHRGADDVRAAEAVPHARARESAHAVAPSSVAAAPLDLSGTHAAEPASHAARQPAAAAAPFAGLKLVPPADGSEAVASGSFAAVPPEHFAPLPPDPFDDDEPPFPADGAVRASAKSRAAAAPPFEPPPFEPRAPQKTHGDARDSAAGARQFTRADDGEWPRAGSRGEADGGGSSRGGGGDPLERIKRGLDARRKPFLVVALEEANAARVGDEELFVAFTPDKKHLRDTLAKPDNVRLLQEVCREALGHDTAVRIVIREADEGEEAPPTRDEEERRERQRLRELAEREPAVQEVLRAFRAEIIEVRRVDGEAPK